MSLVADWRFVARNWLLESNYLAVSSSILRGFRENLCSPGTDLVLEAYPRSGNTYAVALVKHFGGEKFKLARHCHHLIQFRRAQRYGIPAVALIRNPWGAILSQAIRRPDVSTRLHVEEYIRFYRGVTEIQSAVKGSLKIVLFEDVISCPQVLLDILEAVMPGFSYARSEVADIDHLNERIFAIVDEMERRDSGGSVRSSHVARPSFERSQSELAKDKKGELEQLKELMAVATSVFQMLVASAK